MLGRSSWWIENDADFRTRVLIHTTPESLHLDFKSELRSGHDAQVELGRDLAQFANSFGGCLLIGVTEKRDSLKGYKIADEIVGVPDAEKCRENVEQYVRNVLAPSDFERVIRFVHRDGRTCVAVNVPASRRLVWVAPQGRDALEAVKRNNHGKDYMKPFEIERRWSDTLRSVQLAFDDAMRGVDSVHGRTGPVEIELVGDLRIVHPKNMAVRDLATGVKTLGIVDNTGFVLRADIDGSSPTIRVPFELLAAVWADGTRLCVLCALDIVYDVKSRSLRFEPKGG